ncbi:MAG: hypothetical protein J6J17_05355 [Bacilli bacterium]|nr:hypothetical protein [Bacilli bacterium]
MENEIVKCIYEYMQGIKIKVNELSMDKEIFEEQIKSDKEQKQDLAVAYNTFLYEYSIKKISFIIKSIVTLGIYYGLKKDFYRRFEVILSGALDILEYQMKNITECLQIYEMEKQKIENNIKCYNKYYSKIDTFISLINTMTEEEKQNLIYKME